MPWYPRELHSELPLPWLPETADARNVFLKDGGHFKNLPLPYHSKTAKMQHNQEEKASCCILGNNGRTEKPTATRKRLQAAQEDVCSPGIQWFHCDKIKEDFKTFPYLLKRRPWYLSMESTDNWKVSMFQYTPVFGILFHVLPGDCTITCTIITDIFLSFLNMHT